MISGTGEEQILPHLEVEEMDEETLRAILRGRFIEAYSEPFVDEKVVGLSDEDRQELAARRQEDLLSEARADGIRLKFGLRQIEQERRQALRQLQGEKPLIDEAVNAYRAYNELRELQAGGHSKVDPERLELAGAGFFDCLSALSREAQDEVWDRVHAELTQKYEVNGS